MDKITVKNLISPISARTSTSIALLWDKSDECTQYTVYVDGREKAKTSKTDYTAENLDKGEHTFYVEGICKDKIIKYAKIKASTAEVGETVNILDFGAVGDGITVNTKAFERAVNACGENGTVYVPEGVYVTGAFSLKGNMTLFVDDNGVIKGSADCCDYPIEKYRFEGMEQMCYESLINADNAQNITIAGGGTIDANGVRLRRAELAENKGRPGRAVCFRKCANVYLKDITVRQSPAWCVHIIYSENITLNNVKIHTKYDEDGNSYDHIINGDGFDPDSCRNVYVFNSMIASQDDCIAIKSGRDEEGRRVGIPTENVRITNCRFNSGFGVAVGSEMSGSVRNVLVQDCVFRDTFSIASIKPPRGRGGIVKNIVYDNCTMINTDTEIHDCEWFRGGINIDMFYSCVDFDLDTICEINEGTSVIDNIVIKNIELETVGGNAIYIAGLPESRINNLTLENIRAHGKYGMKLYNAYGLNMNNVTVTADLGEIIEEKNVTYAKN